nr:hypothetical protein GCM10025699_11650 [Microbacterium flavescens]
MNPPPALDPEIEDLLWRERMLVAETWEEPYEGPTEVDSAPRVTRHRWDAAASRREELLYAWENAAEQIARWQGVQARLLAEAMDLALEDGATRDDAPLSVRDIAAELACAVGLSDRTVEQRMDDALVMRDRFPQTMAALEAGRLSLPHARVIVDAGVRVPAADDRATFEAAVLERAPASRRAACVWSRRRSPRRRFPPRSRTVMPKRGPHGASPSATSATACPSCGRCFRRCWRTASMTGSRAWRGR